MTTVDRAKANDASTGNGRQTLEQRRAKHASDKVTALEGSRQKTRDGNQEPDPADYARHAKKLPSRILASGLGQASAFLYSKSKKSQPRGDERRSNGDQQSLAGQLLCDIAHWLFVERKLKLGHSDTSEKSITDAIMKSDAQFLRLATAETLAYLAWLNRFLDAKGWAKKDGGDDSN